MSNYRPGTLNDEAVLKRWDYKRRQRLRQANAPTGSQVYSTTLKVQELDLTNLDAISQKADEALAKAEEALEQSGADIEFIDITTEQIKAMFEGDV